MEPTFNPSSNPTLYPTEFPTLDPTEVPSLSPSSQPTLHDHPRTAYTFMVSQQLEGISATNFLSKNVYATEFLDAAAHSLRISRNSIYANTVVVKDIGVQYVKNQDTSSSLRNLQSSGILINYAFGIVLGAGNPYANSDEAFIYLSNNLIDSTSESCVNNCFEDLMIDTTLQNEQSPQVVPAVFGDISLSGATPEEDSGNSDLLLVGVCIGIFLLLSSCYSFYFCFQRDGKDDSDETISLSNSSNPSSDGTVSTINKRQRRMTHISTDNHGKSISSTTILINDQISNSKHLSPDAVNPLHDEKNNLKMNRNRYGHNIKSIRMHGNRYRNDTNMSSISGINSSSSSDLDYASSNDTSSMSSTLEDTRVSEMSDLSGSQTYIEKHKNGKHPKSRPQDKSFIKMRSVLK